MPTRPSLPKQGASCVSALNLGYIADPQQFNHCVRERKSAAGSTLTGMLIWRPLSQSDLKQPLGLWSARSGAHEQMVQFYTHSEPIRR